MSSESGSPSILQDAQVVNSASWGDQVDSQPAENSDIHDSVLNEIVDGVVEEEVEEVEEFEMPEALKQLLAVAGLSLVAVPEGTWNIDGFSAKLRRFYSITFAVDDEVSSADIVEAIAKAGVAVEHIESIQYRSSNRSWCVQFTDQLSKEFILEKGVIHLGGVPVFVGDADFRVVIVKIYEAPPEMPDTVVLGRLSHYGRVLSFRRDRGLATGILNGVRTARMRLSREIPSAIRIAGENVFISYPGQPKTCRKCGDPGHLAQGCKQPRCFNCEAPGHRSADCPKDPLCGICMSSSHPISECPYLRFSANVSSAADQTPSYAEAAGASRPAATATGGNPRRDNQPRQSGSHNSSQQPAADKGDPKSAKKDDRGDRSERRDRRERTPERSDRREKTPERSERDPGRSKGDRDDRDGRDYRRRRSRDWSHSRDRSSRDYDYHRDHRERDRDRRHRKDYSPPLYSSDESDRDERDRRKRHRR